MFNFNDMKWAVRSYTLEHGPRPCGAVTLAAFMDEEDAIDYRDKKLSIYGDGLVIIKIRS